MSRKVLIQQQQPNPPNGPYFGRVSDPVEFMNMQAYAHEHAEGVVRDFLMTGAPGPLVGSGFEYTLPGGLSVSVAAGRAVKTDGRSYDTLPAGEAAVVTMAAADPALPRIDLVYALLETDANAAPVFRPFTQLRTDAQRVAGVAAYPPTQLSVSPEQYNRATIHVRTGTPNVAPVAPAAGANEVALYAVRVNAGATVLGGGNVTDVRSTVRSLFNAWAGIDALNQRPAILNLGEAIDDRVNALVVDSLYFTKLYDDAGNLLTLDADQDAFDARYVNAAGDTMTGPLSVAPAPNATQNAVNVTNSSQANSVPCRGGNFVAASTGTPAWAEFVGVKGHATSQGLAVHSSFLAGVVGSVDGAGGSANALHAGYFAGNLTCTGAFSKASGNFHIDHPLDPGNKDLIHGFVESSKYLLIYKLTAVLASGSVVIDLDAALGFTAGTFQALCQEAEVTSVRSKDGSDADASDVTPDGILSLVTVTCAAPDGTEVVVVVMAERKDPFILSTEFVDAGGRLVPEHPKSAATEDELELLLPVTLNVPAGDPLEGETVTEIVPALIGKQGFARQPEVLAAEQPVRVVTYYNGQSAGPVFAGAGANDASAGEFAWSNPNNITADDLSSAQVIVGGTGATNVLVASGFVFPAIPPGATIVGVEFFVKRWQGGSTGTLADVSVRLTRAGAEGENRAAPGTWMDNNWITAPYGSPADLHGLALTPADFNDGEIGVVFSAEETSGLGSAIARVTYVSVIVYYNEG